MSIINLLFDNITLIQLIIALLMSFNIIIKIAQLFLIILKPVYKNSVNIIIYSIVIIISYKNNLIVFFPIWM